MKESYQKQVKLLLDLIQISLTDKRVALKGGTAINLFHRDFPRYSVDIDLCYLPIEDREHTFKNLHEILQAIKTQIEKVFNYKVTPTNPLNGKKETKLIIFDGEVEIKIEPNFTLRGGLFKTESMQLCERARKEFGRDISIQCMSLADTYGGKICAALDRQHPRDLFDVKYLLENEGLTRDLMDSFIFYLISHNRPIHELLNPSLKDISHPYENEFKDMTNLNVQIEDLIQARERLIKEISKKLDDRDKKFLLTFMDNKPEWTLVREQKIKDYPSVKWKMHNQDKMDDKKRASFIQELEDIFGK